MDPKRFLKNESKEMTEIVRRVKNRDLSGSSGQAIKNSSYNLATIMTAKVGTLVFTILIARIMAPELYGLYGLALSTILLFGFFSDLGINAALHTFLSKIIDKNKRKAKGYFNYLIKYKLILVFLSAIILIIMAKWLSSSYYNKPIYYALLAGGGYLFVNLITNYFAPVFTSQNRFRPIFIKEVIFQTLRLSILPLITIYLLRQGIGTEMLLFWIFITLIFCFIVSSLYFLITLKISHPFDKVKETPLNKKEKIELKRFILPLSATAVSGIFFGYIDQVMLGGKVFGEFIGYYQAGFNLITAAAAIIGFSTAAMFPIFARLDKDKLNKAFRRIRNLIFLISILATIFTIITAPYLIEFIYGKSYLPAVLYLRLFSLLLVSFPLIGLYKTYYIAQKQTLIPSIILIGSTIMNIVLNYLFINFGLFYGMKYAVLGACIATIISRYIYLAGLILWRKR